MNLPSLAPQGTVPVPVTPMNATEPAHTEQANATQGGFIDRRSAERTAAGRAPASGNHGSRGGQGAERRQFGSSHAGLSAAGRELAAAIDQYKLKFRRRYITCDEMLLVLGELGYQRTSTSPDDSAADT